MSVSPAVSDRENALPGKVSDDEVMLWYQNVVKPVARRRCPRPGLNAHFACSANAVRYLQLTQRARK